MSKFNIKSFFFQLFEYFICKGTALKTIRRNIQGAKFEPECFVLDRFIKEGDVVVDIGAGYGRFALFFSRLAGKTGHVYCFEPGDFSNKVLKSVAKFHRLNNTEIYKVAVSDKVQMAKLYIPVKDGNRKPGPSLAYLTTSTYVPKEYLLQDDVQVTTLDKFCEDNQITRMDFLKCDVEGGELLFLRGAKRVLEEMKPAILFEVDPGLLDRFEHTSEDVFAFLTQLGYQAYVLHDKTFNKVDGPQPDEVNYFFVNKDSQLIQTL